MQREQPGDVLPAHRDVSPFYVRHRDEARARVAALEVLGPAEAEQHAEETFSAALRSYEQREREQSAEQGRYEAMLLRVEAWEPPTSEHEGLKRFMAEQLRSSMSFDRYKSPGPQRLTGPIWLAEEREKAARELEHAEEALREEEERCRDANAWIDALDASLP
jgi:hypothetical protein